MKNLTSFLWTLPFLLFLSGYIAMRLLDPTRMMYTPELLGMQALEALQTCSNNNLQLKITESLLDPYMPEGTIIKQKPKPHSPIKKQQTIFVTTSKKPKPLAAPHVIGRFTESIETLCKKEQIRYKIRNIPSNHPQGTCIAQTPDPGVGLEQTKLIAYCADANNIKQYILPSYIGCDIEETTTQLDNSHIPYQVHYQQKKFYQSKNRKIIHQKPIPGSIVSLQDPFCLHLTV